MTSALHFPFSISELSQYYSCEEEEFVADILSYFEQNPANEKYYTEPTMPNILGAQVQVPPQTEDQLPLSILPIAPRQDLTHIPFFNPVESRSLKRRASNVVADLTNYPQPAKYSQVSSEPCTVTPKAPSNNDNAETAEIQPVDSHENDEEKQIREFPDNEKSGGEVEGNGKAKREVFTNVDSTKTKNEDTSGSPTATSNVHSTCSTNKKRQRTTPEQLAILEEVFVTNPSPNQKVRLEISEQIGMLERSVQIWFQNRRAKEKLLKKRRYLMQEDVLRQQYYHAYYNNFAPFHPLVQSEHSNLYNPYDTAQVTPGHIINGVSPEHYYSRMSAPPVYIPPPPFY